MVRQCYVCKIYSYQAEEQKISFHRLPANPGRRNIWVSLLGFEADHQFPKTVEICSRHFKLSDFEYRNDGNRFLRRDAVPESIHSTFNRPESPSSESIVGSSLGSSPSKTHGKNISSGNEADSDGTLTVISSSFEDSPIRKRVMIEEDISSIPGPSTRPSPLSGIIEKVNIDTNDVPVESSSATLTASESEDILMEKGDEKVQETVAELEDPTLELPTRKVSRNIKLKKRKRQYVGDLSSDDFSSPKRAKRNFRLLKNTVIAQKKKIHSLQTTVGSLRKRIRTLNSLLQLLKNKAYITRRISVLQSSLTGSALKLFERTLRVHQHRSIVLLYDHLP